MKYSYFKKAAAALCALAAIGVSDASAALPAAYAPEGSADRAPKAVRPYRGKTPWNAAEAFAPGDKRRAAVDQPAQRFENLVDYDYLEGPDGSMWFYTAEYDIESIKVSEYYSEETITGFTFTIYDAAFNKVGVVKDKLSVNEDIGETKVFDAVLDPSVSVNFFNSDDKPEVMVYVVVNTALYVNNYYNKVYSIGGEKDADGNDVCLMSIPGRCIDSFNAAAPGEPENFFYTFAGDETPDMDQDYDDFVDFVNAYAYPVTVYGKADGGNAPKVVMEKKIYLTRVPGDTTDGIYLITKTQGGKPYFIFSQYEKPYFIDPTGGATNEEATPDNSLVIEVLTVEGGNAKAVTTTRIPVDAETSRDQLLYTFYSIGSVAWKHDVDMSVNGTPQAPAFIVARDVMNAATYEEVLSSYAIYTNDGRLAKPLAVDTESVVVFDTEEGEPEALFVKRDADNNYLFEVAGLYGGSKGFTLDQANGGDPLTASCNRMKDADGRYIYAFEMTEYDIDEDYNEYVKVAWFDDRGQPLRVDAVNMGKDVMAATVNLFSDSMDPYLYDNDADMEYAVLVKRMHGATTRNEFVVADGKGAWYAHFTEDEGKGMPYIFTVLRGAEGNSLMMVYNDNWLFNVDIYALPFILPAGVEGIEAAGDGMARYYDLQGVEVKNPTKGSILIKVEGGKAVKHIVK